MGDQLTPKPRIVDQSRIGGTDARLVRYKDRETVRAILDDTVHAGKLDTITITDAGGLNITWSAGKIYTPAGVIQETAAGGGACTDDAVNYLIWSAGGGLTLGVTPADSDTEVSIGHIQCQEADIWEVHEEPVITFTVPSIKAGLGALFPVIVSSGCVVTPDGGGAAFEVSVSAGTYWHDAHDPHAVSQYDTRTANALVRCFIDGAGPETWDFTAGQSAIDTTQWNDLDAGPPALAATAVGKYYRGLFLISEDNVFHVYPQAQYNTLAAALEADNPSIPPGIALFPKSMAYISKHGDAALVASTDPRWEDERPKVGIAGGGVTVGDLSTYVQGDAGGSTDNHFAIWDGVSGHLLKNSLFTYSHDGGGTVTLTVPAAGQDLILIAPDDIRINPVDECRIGPADEVTIDTTGIAVTGVASVTTSLTTPLLYGQTIAAGTLQLEGSSHGTPAGDSVEIHAEGAKVVDVSDGVLDVTGAITVSSTVDGVDIATRDAQHMPDHHISPLWTPRLICDGEAWPGWHTTSNASLIGGLRIEASLSADVTLWMAFELPNPLPTGYPWIHMRVVGEQPTAAKVMKWSPSWCMVTNETDVDANALTSEGIATVNYDTIDELVSTSGRLDHSSFVAGGFVLFKIVFNTTDWTMDAIATFTEPRIMWHTIS